MTSHSTNKTTNVLSKEDQLIINSDKIVNDTTKVLGERILKANDRPEIFNCKFYYLYYFDFIKRLLFIACKK